MQTDERRRSAGEREAMPPRELTDSEWQHSFVPILKLAGTNKAARGDKDPRAKENAVGDVKHIMVSTRRPTLALAWRKPASSMPTRSPYCCCSSPRFRCGCWLLALKILVRARLNFNCFCCCTAECFS